MKYYRITNLILLAVLVSTTSLLAQAPVHLSSITQNLTTPVRVTIGGGDTVYVADATNNHIAKYTSAGVSVGTIATVGSPISLAINAANEIFYGDGTTGKVFKINAGGTISEVYSSTLFPSSMMFVADTLFVVDTKLKQVLVMDQSGALARTIGVGTLINPVGIAFNTRNNRLLISEHGGLGSPVVSKIWMFDLSGNLISSFGSSGNGNGKFYRIQGLNVDRCGFIYVPDPVQGDITVFDENGTFVSKFGVWGDALGQLNVPLDIKINSNDEVLVTSMNNGALEVYKIYPKLTKAATAKLCQGGTYTFGTQTLSSPGTFVETFTASNGCDSVVTLTLGVVPTPTLTANVIAPPCGDNNGSVTAIPAGGTGPYTYYWNTAPPQITATVTGLTGMPTDVITVTVTDSNGCVVADTYTVDCITNVNAPSGSGAISIYPNPNQGEFTFAINAVLNESAYKFEIYNMIGEKVYENIFDRNTNINLSTQPKGVYFMKISTDNTIIKTEKLVIN